MNEGLFARGRGGITSGQYGGTPEQFAYEQARQEAMLNAQLSARQQVGQEQLRNLQLGQGLQAAGYNPQNQALGLFGASSIPAQMAAQGQRGGAQLQAQASTAGLEGLMQGEQMANLLRQQQLQSLLTGVTGSRDPLTGNFGGGLLSSAADWWSNRGQQEAPLLDPTQYTYDQRYQNVPDFNDVATGIDLSNYNVLDDANYS